GYTCFVVQNAFDYAGVKTVYCDIELDTYGPDLASLATRVTPRTKAILVQHLYGLVCRDYEAIISFARQRGLRIIEDCAHMTGAKFRGKHVGTYGDVAFYSFEWTKIITTITGGVAVTNDPALAEKLARFVSRCGWPQPETVERQLRTAVVAYLKGRGAWRW